LMLFSDNLKKLQNLKELSLDLSESMIMTRPSFEYLCQSLARMSHLERLDFSFQINTRIPLDKAILSLSRSVSQLKSLANLRVDLGRSSPYHIARTVDFSPFFACLDIKRPSNFKDFCIILIG